MEQPASRSLPTGVNRRLLKMSPVAAGRRDALLTVRQAEPARCPKPGVARLVGDVPGRNRGNGLNFFERTAFGIVGECRDGGAASDRGDSTDNDASMEDHGGVRRSNA